MQIAESQRPSDRYEKTNEIPESLKILAENGVRDIYSIQENVGV
jgi:hypothetical protein